MNERSGRMSREPFAWFDRESSRWRTLAPCLDPSFPESPVTWPKSGMTSGGLAYELPTSGCHIDVNDYSLLPTPRASDSNGAGAHGDGGVDLRTAVVSSTAQGGKYEPAVRRWESLFRPSPPPTQRNTRGSQALSPAFSEWMMGWPEGWCTAVEGVRRSDALRIIGNGVVPQQAEAALHWLLSVSGLTE